MSQNMSIDCCLLKTLEPVGFSDPSMLLEARSFRR